MSAQSSTLRKEPQQEGQSAAVALMQAIGSTKGSDPFPPDQYLTFQDARYEPDRRLWAWLLASTIRFGRGNSARYGRRSPFAVSETGKPLRLQDAAVDLKMHLSNLMKAWKVIAGEGRARRDDEGRLWIEGEITLPVISEGKAKKVCTNLFPPYILKQINKLAPERRAELLAEHQADIALQERVQAEFVAGVRFIFDQRQDTRFHAFGVNKVREKVSKKKSRQPAPGFEDRVLPAVERFVQTFHGSVQTSIQVCANQDSMSAQTSDLAPVLPASDHIAEVTEMVPGVPLKRVKRLKEELFSSSSSLGSPTTTTTTTNNETVKTSENTPEIDTALVCSAFRPFCEPDDLGIRIFLQECRAAVPDVTTEEICYLIGTKAALGRRKENPYRYVATCVLTSLSGALFQDLRRQRAAELAEQEANGRRILEAAAAYEKEMAARERAEQAFDALPQEERCRILDAAIAELTADGRYHIDRMTRDQQRGLARSHVIAQKANIATAAGGCAV
jgi:hypothetical protein